MTIPSAGSFFANGVLTPADGVDLAEAVADALAAQTATTAAAEAAALAAAEAAAARTAAQVAEAAAEAAAQATIDASTEVVARVAPQRLMETGAVRLMEDGSSRRLEVADPIFVDGLSGAMKSFDTYVSERGVVETSTGEEQLLVLQGDTVKLQPISDIADIVADSGAVAPAIHYHPSNDWRLGHELLSGGWEQDTTVAVTTANPYYTVSEADCRSRVRVANSGTIVDFGGVDNNTPAILVDVAPGVTTTFYAGYDSANWRGTSTLKLSATAGLYLVTRGQADIVATALPALTTPSVASLPTPVATWVYLGQSYSHRQARLLRGLIEQRRLMGLNTNVLVVRGASTGASRVTNGVATGSYLWDHLTGTPGPNYATALNAVTTAMSANPGAPDATHVIWMHGANEFSGFSGTGPVTPAILSQAYVDAAAKLRTDLGLPNLVFHVVPYCGTDSPAVAQPNHYPQRRAQLETAVLDAKFFRGPDNYDLPRPDGIHQSWTGMSLHGARVAHFIAKRDGSNLWLGPKIVGFSRVSAGRFRVLIDRYGGQSPTGLSVAPVEQPPQPIGFAVHTSSDLFATPMIPTGYEWGTSGSYLSLDLICDGDSLTPDLAYPYGNMATVADEQTRIVRALDRNSGLTLPLQTYHPNPAV